MITAAVMFTLVVGILAAAIIRSRGHEAIAIPRRGTDNPRLQVLWTGGLVLLFAVLAVFMFRVMSTVADPAPSSLPVQVIGHDWWWEFRHPTLGIVTANEITLPVGTPVLSFLVWVHHMFATGLGYWPDALTGIAGSRGRCWTRRWASGTSG